MAHEKDFCRIGVARESSLNNPDLDRTEVDHFRVGLVVRLGATWCPGPCDPGSEGWLVLSFLLGSFFPFRLVRALHPVGYAGQSGLLSTTQAGGRSATTYGFTCNRSRTWRIFSGIWFRT
ncbi:hypothetical protein AVEN_8453-1 [Araneus ventricosus]|uniref:Uncharacterized protein n=1 Tax=Araneus ventricosus TaxID=182803 RepID=A0A4Y2EXK6_ARAVE|nr:hypothetical protein AVEN_8453-1 [Araneus ventricosus]